MPSDQTTPRGHHLPKSLLFFAAILCLSPLLRPVGIDLTSAYGGPLLHSLLEWSSVCAAFMTAFLAILYVRTRPDPLVLTLALAVSISGFWDALHAIASLGLIPTASDLQQFIPFTWAVPRTLKALTLLIGTLYVLRYQREHPRSRLTWLVGAGFALSLLALAFAYLTFRESLPSVLFPQALVTRPWDLPALALFAGTALFLYPRLLEHVPGVLATTMFVAVVPDLLAQLHMSFGSTRLYDHHFIVAHGLKLAALLIAFMGLGLHVVRAYRSESEVAHRLDKTVAELTTTQAELLSKEVRLDQITQSIDDVFWIASADNRTIHYVSDAYEALFGRSCQSLYDDPASFLESVHPDDRQALMDARDNPPSDQLEIEFRVIRPGNSDERWLRVRVFAVRDAQGRIYRTTGLTTDITEQKRALDALRKSEARNRALIEAMPDLMFRLNGDGVILDYHARPGTPLVRRPEEFLGQRVQDIFSEIGQPLKKQVSLALRTGTMQVLEYKLPIGDSILDFEARTVSSGDDEVLSVVRNITEEKRLQREVLDISNREQERIGHDIHDGLSQQLTGMALLCKVLQQRLTARSAPEAADASKLEELLEEAVAQARGLARGLAPVELDVGGLSAALDSLANSVEQLHPLRCIFKGDEELVVADRTVVTHVYRIAQEAVNNAVKHGEPSRIEIGLSEADGRMRLDVVDNGLGLDRAQKVTSGMGLHIMRYRARMIDGVLDIGPASHGGTRVVCEWSTQMEPTKANSSV